MTNKNNGQSQAGFTLLELVAVLFVLTIVTGAMVANFRTGDRQKRVQLASDTVISVLRTAQNYTLTGRQLSDGAPVLSGSRCSGTNANNAAQYYYVHFADNANPQIRAVDRCDAVLMVQEFSLPAGTVVSDITLDEGAGPNDAAQLAVRFVPPFAEMSATAEASPGEDDFETFTEGVVTVQYQNSSATDTVLVNGLSGRIE